jgi:predicted regulator of amino acid metabolism with ACT domain
MKQLFLLVSIVVFLLQSCNVGTSGTWKDENIEQGLKNKIETLDKTVLEAVTTNNSTLIKTIMSDKLLEKSGDNINQMIEKVNGIIKNTDYQVLNQFHVKNSTTGISNTVMTGVSGQDDYIIHYQALNEEMFISLIVSKNGLNKFLITNIYGKYPDGWKLNILQFGQYTINGKTATQLYSEAKSEYDREYLVDAGNNMFLSSQVSNPANTFWEYQKKDEIKQFYATLMSEIKTEYKFPVTMKNIKTNPQIFNIFPQGMKEGYFPMVEYLTNIDLKDTVSIKEENNLMHKSIGQVFKGLDKNKKFIFYKAYSEIPNGKTPVPTYGFVKEIK